jgi:apolipoprotein N-acyltransferase
MMAAALAFAFAPAPASTPQRHAPGHKGKKGSLVLPLLCLGSGLLLQQARWTEPLSTPLQFRLVQPNAKQGNKFDPAYRARITRQVQGLLTAEPADLVLAPETAFPLYWNGLPSDTLTGLQDFAT